MNKYHDIGEIKFCENLLETTIDGVKRRFQLKNISSLLEKASEIERKTFEISSSGYGIHWPLLDEDISIDGLLGIVNAPKGNRHFGMFNGRILIHPQFYDPIDDFQDYM